MDTICLTFFINITAETNISLSNNDNASLNAKLYYPWSYCRLVYKPPYIKCQTNFTIGR